MTITLDDEPCCAKQGYHQKARHHDNSLVILSKTDSAAGRQENPLGFNAVIAPSSHLIKSLAQIFDSKIKARVGGVFARQSSYLQTDGVLRKSTELVEIMAQ